MDIEALVQDQTTSLQWLEQQLLGSTDPRSTQTIPAQPMPAVTIDDIEVLLR